MSAGLVQGEGHRHTQDGRGCSKFGAESLDLLGYVNVGGVLSEENGEIITRKDE